MYKQIDTSYPDGFPLELDKAIAFMQDAYNQPISAIVKAFGNMVIISGCEDLGNNRIADGWIVVDGVPYKFTGGDKLATVMLNTVGSTLVYKGGVNKTVLFENVAAFGSGLNNRNWADFKRINLFEHTWIKGDLKEVDCDAAYIAANFDATGLGKNERLGWAICNGQNGTKNRSGRVSVGYAHNSKPTGNTLGEVAELAMVWDDIYQTIGANGGIKSAPLAVENLPEHNHVEAPFNKASANGDDLPNMNGTTATATDAVGWNKEFVISDMDAAKWQQATIKPVGGNIPHENRQPFFVTLFIQKI